MKPYGRLLTKIRRLLAMAVLGAGVLMSAGCQESLGETKVVLTAGLSGNEVFRIEEMSCYLPEVMVFLTNLQCRYENIFGEEIWERDLGDVTLEESVKETALARIARIKTMNLLALRHGVALTAKEEEKVTEAAAEYYGSLNQAEISAMQATEEIIRQLYREYALADKVYQFIIKDINPEISDDEARTITVQHILFRTYEVDGTGQRIAYSEERKKEAYEKALSVLALAKEEDRDFEKLISDYSEDEKSTYSFGKGEAEEAFEEAAFNLETGEISDIVETSRGYHIIKCVSTFNREETDANKIKIVEKRKEEVFGQEYEAFVKELARQLNEELWESVSLIRDKEVNTDSFFDVYETYFGSGL